MARCRLARLQAFGGGLMGMASVLRGENAKRAQMFALAQARMQCQQVSAGMAQQQAAQMSQMSALQLQQRATQVGLGMQQQRHDSMYSQMNSFRSYGTMTLTPVRLKLSKRAELWGDEFEKRKRLYARRLRVDSWKKSNTEREIAWWRSWLPSHETTEET